MNAITKPTLHALRVHIATPEGKPLCSIAQKVTTWQTDLAEPNCKLCARRKAKKERSSRGDETQTAKFIVQITARAPIGLTVMFLRNGFSLCPDNDATLFPDEASAQTAINNHPNLTQFAPKIMPVNVKPKPTTKSTKDTKI